MKYGIKETLEVLDFGLVFAKSAKLAMADGEATVGDLKYAFPVLQLAPEALEGIQLIGKELQDLDAAELAQLEAKAKEYVGELAPAELQEVISDAIELGVKFGKIAFKIQ